MTDYVANTCVESSTSHVLCLVQYVDLCRPTVPAGVRRRELRVVWRWCVGRGGGGRIDVS